jgi:hypothetical protein
MKIVTYYLFYVCIEHASCHTMTFDAYARVTNPNTAISIDYQHDIMDRSKSVSFFSKLGCVCVVHAYVDERKQTTAIVMLLPSLRARRATRLLSFFSPGIPFSILLTSFSFFFSFVFI